MDCEVIPMFLIIDNNDFEDAEKSVETPSDVYDIVLDYFYEQAGQELDDAVLNATDAENWAQTAIEGDTWRGGDLTIECTPTS